MLYYINPINWVKWIIQFCYFWFNGIGWTNLTTAVPAIIVLLLMSVGGTLAWSTSSSWRDRLVERQLVNAYSAEKYEVAEMLLKRQLRSNREDKRLLVQLAYTYESMGRKEEATELFREQAFGNENSVAALRLLETDFNVAEANSWSTEKMDEFGELTVIALKDRAEDLRLHALRANYLLARNRSDEAVFHLEKLTKTNPLVNLQIAAIYRSQRDEAKAISFADKAASRIAAMVKDEPKRADLRLVHAQALIFLNKRRDAVTTLSEGFSLTKDERLRNALGEAIILFSQSNNVSNSVQQLQLLQQAVRFAPTNPAVLKAISDTILSTIGDDSEDVVRLRENLIAGVAPGIGHFILGTQAMIEGNSELAALELRLAAKELPESPAILNNLAVAEIAKAKANAADKLSLETALQLVDKAIELVQSTEFSAQLPYFRETRGQVYLAMKRFEDAIPEFDAAINVPRLSEQAHRSLAEAYDGLNQAGKAAEHRQKADEIKRKIEAENAAEKSAVEEFSDTLRESNQEDAPTEEVEGESTPTEDASGPKLP